MALSKRFTQTCFSSSGLPVMVCSSSSRFISRPFDSHFRSSSSTQVRSCSDTLKVATSVRMAWFSTLVRFSTLVAIRLRRLLSLSIMSRYSACSLGSRLPCFKRLANPAMETMGVLNSWEKLLIKSERRTSVPSSSAAVVLKLSIMSRTGGMELKIFPGKIRAL